MASYPPPTNSDSIYNPTYYINPTQTSDSTITTEYLAENYLPSTGIADSNASVTTFSGEVNVINSNNATSSSGSITSLGGISLIKDLYIGSGNIISNSTTSSIFTNCNTINVGVSTGTLNVGNIVSKSLTCSSGNIITTSLTSNIFTTSTTINVGNSQTGTLIVGNVSAKDITTSSGNLISTSLSSNIFANATTINIGSSNGNVTVGNLLLKDLTTSTGNLITSANTANIFNTPSTLSIGNLASTLNIGSSTGTLNLKNPIVSLSNSLSFQTSSTVFNSGANYLSGRIACLMPFTGNFKCVMISCIQATSSSQGTWSSTFTYPTQFSLSNTGVSVIKLTNLNSANDSNSTVTGSNTSCSITILANSQSNNIYLIIGS